MLEKFPEAARTRFDNPATVERRNPLNLLIFGGILLIAAIAVGTSFTIVSFRQRALANSERELQNTVLLLARHFDRELDSFDAVQRDYVRRVQDRGIRTAEAFNRQMSGEAAHESLQTLVSASPETARFNIFDASGRLINSSLNGRSLRSTSPTATISRSSSSIRRRPMSPSSWSIAASATVGPLSSCARSPDRTAAFSAWSPAA